jgi:hypothetical protein
VRQPNLSAARDGAKKRAAPEQHVEATLVRSSETEKLRKLPLSTESISGISMKPEEDMNYV